VLLRNSYASADISLEIKNEEKRSQRLRVDLERWRSPARIAEKATELHLVQPTLGEEAIILQRVRPADLPAHSVLARR
jgi:hypothetical protein